MDNKKPRKSVEVEKKVIEFVKKDRLKKLFEKHKFQIFHEQDPKKKVETFQSFLTELKYSTIKAPNSPWEINYKYQQSIGVTKIQLANKYDPKRPTLIFHHGLLSTRPVIQLRIIANSYFYKKFNIFVIRASYHERIKQAIKNYINSFNNLTSSTAASVIAINKIIDFHNSLSRKPVIVTGISLGGIVTSLHYFYFNSADYYFPIIAYPNLGEIILDKNNKDFVTNYDLINKNESIKESYKIPKSLRDKPRNKIFPIISEYDELIRFKKAQKFWKDYEVKTLNVGHFSVFVKRKEIREYILSKIRK